MAKKFVIKSLKTSQYYKNFSQFYGVRWVNNIQSAKHYSSHSSAFDAISNAFSIKNNINRKLNNFSTPIFEETEDEITINEVEITYEETEGAAIGQNLILLSKAIQNSQRRHTYANCELCILTKKLIEKNAINDFKYILFVKAYYELPIRVNSSYSRTDVSKLRTMVSHLKEIGIPKKDYIYTTPFLAIKDENTLMKIRLSNSEMIEKCWELPDFNLVIGK